MAITIRQPQAYTNRIIYDIPASVPTEKFMAAWSMNYQRHAILRTRIDPDVDRESNFVQVVVREKLEWQRSADLDGYVKHDQAQGLTHGSQLARFCIVSGLEGEPRKFVWTIHHSIYDGWTLKLILEDLGELYEGHTLPPCVPFNGFVDHLRNVDNTAAAAFWHSELDGELPTSYPPLPTSNFQSRPDSSVVRDVMLPHETSNQSIPNILQAAWPLALSMHTATDDVMYAMTLSGRNAPVPLIAEMAGPTIATVLIRRRINSSTTISQYLSATHRKSIDMMPFEHTGIQNIDKPLALNTLLVIQPTIRVDHDEENQERQEPMISLDPNAAPLQGFDSYALVVECSLNQHGARIEARYDKRVITEEQIQRLISQFQRLIILLLTEPPTTRLVDLLMASEEDVQQISTWHNEFGTTLEGVNECLDHAIRRQALEQPLAQAVCAWDGNLSYQELERLATKLAGHLKSLSIKPEVKVPVYFDKSLWAIIAMLAILKAGGIYVPLNSSHPLQHIEIIIGSDRPGGADYKRKCAQIQELDCCGR